VWKEAPVPVPWALVVGALVVGVLAGGVGGLVVGLSAKKP
jgi:hypothetical protein